MVSAIFMEGERHALEAIVVVIDCHIGIMALTFSI